MFHLDKDKTAFITESANYCYEAMSLDLKNVGATYQRLIDKIFKEQIDRNMEIYVSDMVVKYNSMKNHVQDLEEMFQQIR